ncbi:MAG: inner-membrane translocator [Bacillus thermozeamaize]|uniref:Inner-membrane translocator n=1 Tax=Bacillus thermozeamaize TaxID=230954 RepID=A0A1Y3PBQ0_9BACI|nr:MAG: inner-membrane translocator [Bacillus thermozeamaize]
MAERCGDSVRLRWKPIALVVLLVLLAVYPFLVGKSNYYMTLFAMMCIYAIAAMALNLLTGFGGQVSVGHAGFLAVGGYAAAILSTKVGMPFILALLLAGVVTGLIGLLIGLPAVRLRGHFLAVATLGFGLSIPQIALNWDDLTGGYSGIFVNKPVLFDTEFKFYYVVVVSIVLITWIIYNILRSALGRAFVAIRESEVAAQAMGIHVAFYKTVMFVISAFFTGLAGGLYGYWVGFISPNDFTATTSFMLLAMIVVGGLASLPGAILGAVLFTLIPHFTSQFVGVTNLVIGLAMALIILFRPQGLVSLGQLFSAKKRQSGDVSEQEAGELEKGAEEKYVNV